jgi:hypothetical protein
MRKNVLSAIAAAIVVGLGLPVAASATQWHLSSSNAAFTVHGGQKVLKTTSGTTFECTTTTGTGQFTSTTGGNMNLTYHGCKNVGLGIACTSAGQPSGTIVTSGLRFDGIMIAAGQPGLLVTPPATGEEVTPGKRSFATYSCFGVAVKIFGAGFIGTITTPKCGEAKTTAGLTFGSTGTPGHQKHTTWTGSTYDLETQTGGGAHTTASLDAVTTLTFLSAQTITCT